MTGPIIPTVLPGVKAVHAVDAAGVHPLLLAIGSERYVPYDQPARPQELLTQASAILGQGQMSLAKYLWIADAADNPTLDLQKVDDFLVHMLQRVDWSRDLHFQTCTTIDTLDYSGTGFNEGSKLVIAAVGHPRRELPRAVEGDWTLPAGFHDPRLCLPGIVALSAPPAIEAHDGFHGSRAEIERFCGAIADLIKVSFTDSSSPGHPIQRFPLVVLVDDSHFAAASLANFLWVTFTRSDPASDVYGIGATVRQKHWGCGSPLVIDARRKPRHAPPLIEDPRVTRRVDRLFMREGPLQGLE